MDEFQQELVKSTVEQTVGAAYTDIVSPSAKPIGTVISLLPRTIRLFFSKWEKWVVNAEKCLELTAESIQEKVAKIPEEKLTEPEPYVAVPALQQLSYSLDSKDLREMYANLLASSMNIDTKVCVHPAFVEIIKQLCPDETKLLKYLSRHSQQPIIDIKLNLANRQGYITKLQNFTTIADDVCDNPSAIGSYLDNLARLKLIDIIKDEYYTIEKLYKPLIEHPKVMSLMNSHVQGGSYEIEKHKFELTTFAKDFIRVCL